MTKNLSHKYLMKSHTSIGLLALLFFYLATFFGAIMLFKPYLQIWQNPSLYFPKTSRTINLDFAMHKALKELNYPNSNIKVDFPSSRQKVLKVTHGFSNEVWINPYTNKVIERGSEDDFLTQFFNDIHLGRNIPIFGQWLMGLSSLGMLFLMLSGIFLYWKNRQKKGAKTTGYKWHKKLSLFLLPYVLIFALTGSVLGFMLNSSSPFAYATTNFKQSNMRSLVAPILFKKEKPVLKEEQNVDMLEYQKLYAIAKKEYVNLNIVGFELFNWYEDKGRIVFFGYLKNNRAISGKINRMSITLEGKTGKVLFKKSLKEANVGNSILSLFYFLHFIPDEELNVRIILFIGSVLLLTSLGCGYYVWSNKKRRKHNCIKHYNFLNKITLSVMVGVVPLSALMLFCYWLIPFDFSFRQSLLWSLFYTAWAMIFFIYVMRLKSTVVTLNLLRLTACLFFMIPFIRGFKTNVYIWEAWSLKLNVVMLIDAAFLMFSIFLFLFSWFFQRRFV